MYILTTNNHSFGVRGRPHANDLTKLAHIGSILSSVTITISSIIDIGISISIIIISIVVLSRFITDINSEPYTPNPKS